MDIPFGAQTKAGQALSIPFLVFIILGFAYPYESGIVLSLLLSIPSILVASMIAVAVHRVILLGPDSVRDYFSSPDKRVLLFFAYSIGLGIVLLPVAIVLFLLPFGIYLYFVCAAYLIGRLSLVFPAIAVDAAWTFGDSWKATKEHHFAMFVVVGLIPIMLIVLDLLLLFSTFITNFWSVFSAMLFIYFIAILSVSFQHLRNRI